MGEGARPRRRRTVFQRIALWVLPAGATGEQGQRRAARVLEEHFFQRFFDNDAVSSYGDTLTTVSNALMLTALPGLLVGGFTFAFLLHPLPMAVGNFTDYLFVLYTFTGMGLVAVFEWETLFADRIDFLILTPLPVTKGVVLKAKLKALGRFLGMFLLAANGLSTLFVPGVKGHNYLWTVTAHAISVTMAGSFAALLVLAAGGVMLCVLGAATFRRVLPIVQLWMVAVLVWMMLQLKLFVAALAMPGRMPPEFVQWLPPFWFVSVYQKLLLGGAAPEFVGRMARMGAEALVLVAVLAAATYPLAWRRKQKMTLEDAGGGGQRRAGVLAGMLARVAARRPEERAVFAFIGQTIRRSSRYQTYLVLYGGVGLALAGACVVQVAGAAQKVRLVVSGDGLYALMALLLFWLVAGLRAAFAMPVDLKAAWVFTVSGVELGRCAAVARRWVSLYALVLVACVLVLMRAMGWDARRLWVQAVMGASLALVLADVVFAVRRGIPFTRPRLPGKSNVAIAVAVYVFALMCLPFVMELAQWLEQRPVMLWVPATAAVMLRLGLREVQRRSGLVYELHEEELEGTLTLGLHT